LRKIKTARAFFQGERFESLGLLSGRELLPILSRQTYARVFMHELFWLGQMFPVKRGAKDGMTIDDLLPGFFKRVCVEPFAKSAANLDQSGACPVAAEALKQKPLLHG
jgi:hypothetical protein